MDIHISSHDFKKINIVTITDKKRKSVYDEYVCDTCGCKGKRYGLTEYITISTPSKATCKRVVIHKRVKITGGYVCRAFGFEPKSVHDIVPSPNVKYVNDVWVFSEARNEPVRLLPHEFEYIKEK